MTRLTSKAIILANGFLFNVEVAHIFGGEKAAKLRIETLKEAEEWPEVCEVLGGPERSEIILTMLTGGMPRRLAVEAAGLVLA